jgi:ubiquinone/menaquinone biosynthesis C-methylase UbiE
MPKTVLVICSDNSGKDFPKDENQNMLKQLLGNDYIVQFMDRYPENLPTKENEFDAVLFAGCNVITWLFKLDYEVGMEKLSRILKQDGIIIFVENQKYIDNIAIKGKSYSLSIPLEEIKLRPTIKDDNTGLKQEILKSWEKFFELNQIDNYFVYKVKGKQGGKYKRKTAHKKRKTANKKRKTAHKKRKTIRKRI